MSVNAAWLGSCSMRANTLTRSHTLARSICFHLWVTLAMQQVVIQMEAGISHHSRRRSLLIPCWVRWLVSLHHSHFQYLIHSFIKNKKKNAVCTIKSIHPGLYLKMNFLQLQGVSLAFFLLSLLIFSRLCARFRAGYSVFVAGLLSLFLKSFPFLPECVGTPATWSLSKCPLDFFFPLSLLITILFIFLHERWLQRGAPHILCHLLFFFCLQRRGQICSFSSLLLKFARLRLKSRSSTHVPAFHRPLFLIKARKTNRASWKDFSPWPSLTCCTVHMWAPLLCCFRRPRRWQPDDSRSDALFALLSFSSVRPL